MPLEQPDSDQQLTGSTFIGQPSIVGGVYYGSGPVGSLAAYVQTIQVDPSGSQYITTTGSLAVAPGDGAVFSTLLVGQASVNNFPATQAVSGTVTANVTFPANQQVWIAETQGVSGTVTSIIGNWPATIGVSASATLPVSIAGTVNTSQQGQISVNNFPATQNVSSSSGVKVWNFASVDVTSSLGLKIWNAAPVGVSASVQLPVFSTSPLGVTGSVTSSMADDVLHAGTITGSGGTTVINLTAGYSSVAWQLGGVWTGTIFFEKSMDAVTWFTSSFYDASQSNAVNVVTGSGYYFSSVGGTNYIRLRAGTGAWTGTLNWQNELSFGVKSVTVQDALPAGGNLIGAVGGIYGATTIGLSVDSSGRLITAAASAAASLAGLANGRVALNTATASACNATAYTEQSANFNGSIVSNSANDTSAGTGARTVTITYYDSTGAGPNTFTATLNGTTAVNLTGFTGNMCFIESIVVTTAGSDGQNDGIISLHAGTGGTGTLIGTIAADDNRTFWCHHYVATGKTCHVTTLAGSQLGAQGNSIYIKARQIGSNSLDIIVSDYVRPIVGSGDVAGTVVRTYGTPLQVTGPARLQAWILPDQGTTSTYYASFDFYDQ